MPVTGIRFTMFFQSGKRGFSESYVNTSVGELASLYNGALALFKARLKLCGYPVIPAGGRLSKEGVFRDSLLIKPEDIGPYAPALITYASVGSYTVTNRADQAKSAILVRMDASPTSRKSTFLAGVPDALIGEGNDTINVSAIPDWLTNFNAFGTALTTGGWGFIGRSEKTGDFVDRQIMDILTDVTTGWAIIVTQSAATMYAAGTQVQIIRSHRLNPGFTPLNGLWIVETSTANSPAAGQQSYLLRNSLNIVKTHFDKYGFISAFDRSTRPIINVQLLGPTTRKRGRIFGVGPGRRKAQSRVTI